MAALKINISKGLRLRLRTRATKDGFRKVEDYAQAILIADTTPEMNDKQIEELLLSRIDGPFVKVDHVDFEQMRTKLKKRLQARAGRGQ